MEQLKRGDGEQRREGERGGGREGGREREGGEREREGGVETALCVCSRPDL